MQNNDNINILFFGAGPVGATVGGWIASAYNNITFLDQGAIADALKQDGLTLYEGGKKQKQRVPVNVVTDLSAAPEPDVIVVCVKNYSLHAVSKIIKDKFGDAPVIVALQNGVENQKILPQYFSQVIYGVVCYNAWMDSPGVVGYQKKGPIVLGTIGNEHRFEMQAISRIFNKGVPTIVVDHLMDAAASKMIINLTNSLTTLVGHRFREISDPAIFQKLLSNLTYEGSQIVKAAGYKECRLGGMPSWLLLRASVLLPQQLTKGMFEKNVKKMVVSSMAQDVIQRGNYDTELDTINGWFIEQADRLNIKAPYNRTIYNLCKEKFKPGFQPIDVKEVWEEVSKAL